MESIVNLEIMEFIEQQILPRYQNFDAAHRLSHVSQVINQSIILAKKLGADVDMAYVVAAYHDLGLEGPRAIHHLTSGKILSADKRLYKWFSSEQINIMKQAVEDHRASAAKAPRNIYGRIVAEADRDLRVDVVIRRTIQFGLANYPEMKKEEHFNRLLKHLHDKYSEVGYIHLWISGSENEKNLKKLRALIVDKKQLFEIFENIYAEEKGMF